MDYVYVSPFFLLFFRTMSSELKLSQELVCVVSVWACDMPLLLRDYYGEGERK